MAARPVGRRNEIDRIAGALDAVAAGQPGRIVELIGEAGIGKSTVVREVISMASQSGWRVWSATPTAAEADLSWTGLAQMLSKVRQGDLDVLVEGQLAQIEAATSATRPGPVSPEIVAFALESLLDTAAAGATGPLLVVIDDLQWLDRATAGALAYALRGMARRQALALLARRVGQAAPLEPDRLVDDGSYGMIELSGVDLPSLREIITGQFDIALGRAELARLHELTGGNPLYAVELAREISTGSTPGAAALPESLRDTLGRRVRALPSRTRVVLAAAAMAARPTIGLLEAAFPGVDVLAAFGPAERAGIATLSSTVVFAHPLLAAAAVDVLTTAERVRIHNALAACTDDPVERAAHLIDGSTLRGEALAVALDDAARIASGRGAVDAAVEYARASLAATPTSTGVPLRLERQYTVGSCQIAAGDLSKGQRALTALLDDLGTACSRTVDLAENTAFNDLLGRALAAQVLPTAVVDGIEAGVAVAWRALDVVSEPAERYALHAELVRLSQFDNADQGLEIAEAVFAPYGEHGGAFGVHAAAQLLVARTLAGVPADVDAVLGRIGSAGLDPEQHAELCGVLVEPLHWSDHERTVEYAAAEVTHQEQHGSRLALLTALETFGSALYLRGEWGTAEQALRRAAELAVDNPYTQTSKAGLAALLAGRGHHDAATDLILSIERAFVRAEPGPTPRLWLLARRGEVALAAGSATAADDLLAAERAALEIGLRSVRTVRFRRSLVEALVNAGRIEEARGAAERLTVDARRGAIDSAMADADAAEAIVAAAGGDDSRWSFAAAIGVQRRLGLSYELARTLLSAGTASRRAGRRSDARQQLDEACSLFRGMGATAWEHRGNHEIARLEVRRARSGSPTDGLTPTQQAIAELVASGRTNAEIAATMFVSVRTVESHLTRSYRMLGIRSRTELARFVAERATSHPQRTRGRLGVVGKLE